MTSKTLVEIRMEPFAEGITFKMPAADRAKWLNGLRSGQYEQGWGTLQRFGGSCCCLGVWQMVTDGDVERDYRGNSCSMPSNMWLNKHGIILKNAISTILVVPYNGMMTSLSTLNDVHKLSFTEIADLIEKHSEGY